MYYDIYIYFFFYLLYKQWSHFLGFWEALAALVMQKERKADLMIVEIDGQPLMHLNPRLNMFQPLTTESSELVLKYELVTLRD